MREMRVTRTIVSTKVTVMAVDTETAEVTNITIVVPRTFSENEKLLKAVKKQAETATTKIVAIVDKTEQETLYGMLESDFIAHAEVLDPTTRKPVTADAE